MAVLTQANKQTIKRLLKTGRWNNQSEVMCAAIHLLDQQVQAESFRDLSPYPLGTLAKAYRQMTPKEKAEEHRLAKASARLKPKPSDFE
jgi:Arc/MetJ-type ribon-helix-helix transcriptional regulator